MNGHQRFGSEAAFRGRMIGGHQAAHAVTYDRFKTPDLSSPMFHSYHVLLYFHLVYPQGLYTDCNKIVVRKVSLLKAYCVFQSQIY